MSEEINLNPASIKNRLFSSMIDLFIIYMLEFICLKISWIIYLKEDFFNFISKYKLLFSSGKFGGLEFNYFLNSKLASSLLCLMTSMILIAILYNVIFLKTKWSATLGQKLNGVYIISKSGAKVNFLQAIVRSILLLFPIMFIMFLIIYQKLAFDKLLQPLDRISIGIVIFIFISWYDLIFFTRDKLFFHDYITKTKVVTKNTISKTNTKINTGLPFFKTFFPDFKENLNTMKNIINNQIQRFKIIRENYKNKKKIK